MILGSILFRGKKTLAVVPARGGSTRFPGKNLQMLAGKPLILWTLETAKETSVIDRIVLSTDDQVIARSASKHGFTDFVRRPATLATNNSSMTSVLVHVIETLLKQGEEFGYMVLLQPTSPLRTAEHIQEAFSLMDQRRGEGVVSVCRTEHPKEWMGEIGEDGSLDAFFRETQPDLQSQECAPSYQINGAIYIVPVEQFLERKTLFFPTGMVAYIMDRSESIDIDYDQDLRLAEWSLQNQHYIKR